MNADAVTVAAILALVLGLGYAVGAEWRQRRGRQ